MTPMIRHAKSAALLLLFSAAALALLAAAAAADEFDEGKFQGKDMPDFSKPRVCPPFRCSSGHSAVPKSRQRFESAGCGSMGAGMMMMTGAAKDDSKTIGPCCDKWHACYQICGSNKAQCDESFKKCGEDACGKIPDEQEKKDCEQSASMNSMMLGLGDCRKFDEAQRSACSCVMSSKVTGYRKDAIRGFYKKYAPDGLDDDKIKTLAEKADTRAKMAGLFQKLVAKYPRSIRKVKDPQQAYMDDMMRKAKEEKMDEGGTEESGGMDDDSDETEEL